MKHNLYLLIPKENNKHSVQNIKAKYIFKKSRNKNLEKKSERGIKDGEERNGHIRF